MTDSILDSIKKLLGVDPDYTAFDTDIIIHINSALSVLNQIGAGPTDGVWITGRSETWEALLSDKKQAEMVKSYVYLRTRLLFDPPQTSFAIDSMKKQADEFEWRLNVMELYFNPNAWAYLDQVDVNDPTYLSLVLALAAERDARIAKDEEIEAYLASLEVGGNGGLGLMGEWQINPQPGVVPHGHQLSCDTGVFATATWLRFVKLDESSTDFSTLISNAVSMYGQMKSNSDNWITYDFAGPAVDMGSYIQRPVTFKESGGSIAVAQWQAAKIVFRTA